MACSQHLHSKLLHSIPRDQSTYPSRYWQSQQANFSRQHPTARSPSGMQNQSTQRPQILQNNNRSSASQDRHRPDPNLEKEEESARLNRALDNCLDPDYPNPFAGICDNSNQ
ncbi:hypothetical protein NHQ30_002223 [Ciborinia camelliae]|nr:hypothetical protein NHQ30_002223 [Ciborinia camelliae]